MIVYLIVYLSPSSTLLRGSGVFTLSSKNLKVWVRSVSSSVGSFSEVGYSVPHLLGGTTWDGGDDWVFSSSVLFSNKIR